MKKSSIRSCYCALAFLLSAGWSASAQAGLAIQSVTLNGASSVDVAPSASITAVISNKNTAGDNWKSTKWNISGDNCVNHSDHNGTGTFNETFTITAPAACKNSWTR